MNALIRNRTLFVPVCESKRPKENPINSSRKAFEKKRNLTLKENVNVLLKIANIDIKEYGDFIKELDELHKNELSKVFKKQQSFDEASISLGEAINEENIFKK